ncbi:MAG: response regulator [bacterium]|nr:response regulator [bacterium]
MTEGRSLRIVIAEDDYLVSEEVVRAVKSLGHEIVGDAADGVEALRLVREQRPDVVLLDIRMPEMDGLAAARRIQEECPTPVVILTAHESQELVAEAADAGVSAYLTKPPQAQQIDRALVVALVRHRDMMELRRLNAELSERNDRLAQALAEIKTLRGILPICTFCKRVRDDAGYWEQVDVYLHDHTGADVSHGICPDCMKKHYPEYFEEE